MREEAVCIGVDVAKSALDVAVTDSEEVRQFANNDKGISQAASYIAGLKPAMIILEANGNLEMPLAAPLQADRLPVVVINPRQVRDFARATGALARFESEHLPEARETLSRIDSRFSRIKNDIRQSLRCKLEIACKNFSEALLISQYINDKDSFIYKKLRHDALEGELVTSVLSDQTRKEYKSEFAQLDKELEPIKIDEIISLTFDIEY